MAGGKATSRWFKMGQLGSNPQAPGSYGGWMKQRKPPKAYPTLPQQRNIGEAGRAVGKECKGKTGSVYFQCRSEALASFRKR